MSSARILRPLADSPDFSELDIEGNFLGLTSKRIGNANVNVTYFPLDPSYVAALTHLTKAQYEYFSSNVKGKKDVEEFQEYRKNCFKALPPADDWNELLGKREKCVDALKEKITKNIYTDDKLKILIDKYVSGKNNVFVENIINYFFYNRIVLAFGDKIKRFRQGHSQILVLGFQDSRNEYPLDHAIAAKITSPKGIIVVNSENRHLGANKTLKMRLQTND